MTFRETTGGRVCPHNVPVDYRCYTCQPFSPSETTVPQVSPNMMPTPLPPQPAFGFRFVPSACEHCFCRDAEPVAWFTDRAHQECCNCGVRRVKPTGQS